MFGSDAYRYYFLRHIAWGADGDFSWEAMVDRHNADLANGLGNLASRVLAMLRSYFDGLVPEPTVAQRIVRAKRTLAEARVPFEVPAALLQSARRISKDDASWWMSWRSTGTTNVVSRRAMT